MAGDRGAKSGGHATIDPASDVNEEPENQAAPKEVLPEEKGEVGPPLGAKKLLTLPGREGRFQRAKDEEEEEETEAHRDEDEDRAGKDNRPQPLRKGIDDGKIGRASGRERV